MESKDKDSFVSKAAELSVDLFRIHESEVIVTYQKIKLLEMETSILRAALADLGGPMYFEEWIKQRGIDKYGTIIPTSKE